MAARQLRRPFIREQWGPRRTVPGKGSGDDVAATMVDHVAVRGNARFSRADPRFYATKQATTERGDRVQAVIFAYEAGLVSPGDAGS